MDAIYWVGGRRVGTQGRWNGVEVIEKALLNTVLNECSYIIYRNLLKLPEGVSSHDKSIKLKKTKLPCHKRMYLHPYPDTPCTLFFGADGAIRPDIEDLVHKDSKIFWEAFGIDRPKGSSILTMPCGMIPLYGHHEDALEHICESSVDRKPNLALAAWGAQWPSTNTIKDRQDLAAFVSKSSFLERTQIPKETWWKTLSSYKFQLCPLGWGIQAPKVLESLIVQTIPIVQRVQANEDLKAYGYPIVLVDSWEEVTEENLERWWEEISPELERKRWLCTTAGWWMVIDALHQDECRRKILG